MLGKIYKYEFMALARKLIFILIVTLVVSFGLGCVLRDGLERGTESFELDCNSASGFETFFLISVSLVFFVITLSAIEKRFEKSLLGDEGYLNNSLPVTFGTHMWGRWLAGMSWMIIMAAGVALSTFMFVIPVWKYVIETPVIFNIDFNGTEMEGFLGILQVTIYIFFFVSLLISFSFMVKAVASISTKHKRLISTIVIIVSILLYIFIKGKFVYSINLPNDSAWIYCLISNLFTTIITGVNFGITYYLLGKKLDLV